MSPLKFTCAGWGRLSRSWALSNTSSERHFIHEGPYTSIARLRVGRRSTSVVIQKRIGRILAVVTLATLGFDKEAELVTAIDRRATLKSFAERTTSALTF